MVVKLIYKRDGKKARFEEDKVKKAIFKAAHSAFVQGPETVAEEIYSEVKVQMNRFNGTPPKIEEIEEIIIGAAREKGYGNIASAYQSYKERRARARELLGIMSQTGTSNTTDANLLIESDSKDQLSTWNRERVIEQLENEANLSREFARDISKNVENIIVDLYDRGIRRLKTTQIRTLVDLVLAQEGLEPERRKQELLGIPARDLESALINMNHENSNVASNNPEAVNLFIAEGILKPYALENVFSPEVADAHRNGAIHLHDLGYIDRVYCSSHSLEYLKKYGLEKVLANLESKSGSPNSAAVLNQHVQTFLASMQSNYAGALGFGFTNIFYAPLLNRPVEVVKGVIGDQVWEFEKKDLDKLVEQGQITFEKEEAKDGKKYMQKVESIVKLKELPYHEYKQTAQNLIFAASQNAFSRGGQTLFIDFNIHTGVPEYLKNVPAIGPKGKYMIQKKDGSVELLEEVPRIKTENSSDPTNGDADQAQIKEGRILTYGDFEPQVQKYAKAMLEIWQEGDKVGRPFHFPKCDLHIDDHSFDGKEQEKLIDFASQVASENGSVYFMFDRGSGVNLAQCCRLRERVTDMSMVKNPERLRFCGFQNVTINMPQAAYKGKDLEGTLKEIDGAMELAYQAHMQKKEYIQKLLDTDGSPLRSLGLPSDDGKPYVDLAKCTYIIGNIGLNETVEALIGKQLHETEEAYDLGLKIVAHMNANIQRFKKRSGLKFTIEETPAESTTRRLAKVDMQKYNGNAKKVVKGTEENPYYTNSIHYAPGAAISLVDRTVGQSNHHQMIESGAIVHAWVGEHRPDAQAIKSMVKSTLEETMCSQLVYSPTYTECDACGTVIPGEKELCTTPNCTNHKKETLNPKTLNPVTRIVGYNSRIKNWNGSQQQIYQDRKEAEANYAGAKGIDMPWLYSPKAPEKLTIMQFGKHGCEKCDETRENVQQKLAALGLEGKAEFKMFYLDDPDDPSFEEGLFEATRYGVPLDSVPTLVIPGKESYFKKTTKYATACTSGTCSLDFAKENVFISAGDIESAITVRLKDYNL